jgi:peptide/nickel transport system substrate-binding protein
MKKILSLSVAFLLSVTILTGCGSSGMETNKPSPDISKEPDDTITIATNLGATTPDPTIVEDTDTIWKLEIALEGLVRTSDDGTKIVPCLADSWDISNDGLKYTFHLKKGIRFADGNYVTPDDWIWSFERAMNATEGYWIFACSNIDKVASPDDSTLVLTLKTPDAATLSKLTCFNMTVQEKSFYIAKGSYDNNFPIGTGSYYVKEWVRDDHILYAANPYYHGNAPKTSTIKFTVVTDDDSRVEQLKKGNVDIITEVPYSSMPVLDKMDGISVDGFKSTASKYLVLNTTDQILLNQKVRQALLMGTNKQEIVDRCLFGYGEPAVSYMPKNGLFWDNEIKPVEYNPEKAKALLEDAGYPNGIKLEFLVRSGNSLYEQIAEIISEQWSKIGVDVTIKTLETSELLERETSMKHQVCIGSWSDDIADPSQLSDYLWRYDNSQCFFTGYNNPDATAIYNAATTELDDTKREEYYKKLQEISYNSAHLITLFHSEYAVAMKDNISGFYKTPLGSYRLDNLVKN